MLQLNLSDAEIQRLRYETFGYPCMMVQKRILAVLLKAETELSNEKIGEIVDLNLNTVGKWLEAYQCGGIGALYKFGYGTNKSSLDERAPDILGSFIQHPPASANEARERIGDMTGIYRSPTQICEFMKRFGLKYRKTGHIPAKADTEQQREWLEAIMKPAIKAAKAGECHLLFMDAAHFILQPFICSLWCITRLFIKASSGRNRINILGTVNAVTKEIITCSNTHFINAETIVDFLIQLRTRYSDLPIKIILDNARYQHCKPVTETAAELGIHLLFLPPYSPNLNIIERLWKFTRKKVLYARYYDSPAKFHQAIIGFFHTINQKHYSELQKLMSLKFQVFNINNSQIYPV